MWVMRNVISTKLIPYTVRMHHCVDWRDGDSADSHWGATEFGFFWYYSYPEQEFSQFSSVPLRKCWNGVPIIL
jgi:hypothetical protein